MNSHSRVTPPAPLAPLPTPSQLAWQDLEFYAFAHFGVNTFTDREWGEGTEPETVFNPTALDADQWARAAKAAGMKGIIVTAKHHDGFCLWPSKLTEHSVKNSLWKGGKGDIVREVSDACKARGLLFGVYLSPWDRHERSYGDSPRYNAYYLGQLHELLSQYGHVFEQWFDGACGEGPNGKRQEYDWDGFWGAVHKLQPQAIIFGDGGPGCRWVGNEDGYADETNWCPFDNANKYPGKSTNHQTVGDENGTVWAPTECDVSIRPGWFYHASQDNEVKSLKELLDIYFGSVGRGGNLLLNVPPDRRGLWHENDVKRLKEFGDAVKAIFRTDLARGSKASAGNVRGGSERFAAQKLVGGRKGSYWATDDDVTTGWVELKLTKPSVFDVVMLQEQIALGQRVAAFGVDAWVDGGWKEIAKGTTIGHKRLLRIDPVNTDRVRVRIERSRACPTLSRFGLFKRPAGL